MRGTYLARGGLVEMDSADLVRDASTLTMDLRVGRVELHQGTQWTRNSLRVNQISLWVNQISFGGKIQIWVNQIEISKIHQEIGQWRQNWFYRMRRLLTCKNR